jgi:hypothetical protein
MPKIELDLQKALAFLVESNIVPKDLITNASAQLDDEILIECMQKGSEFYYDSFEDELYYVVDNETKIKAPDLSEGMSTSANWLVDHLPDLIFDIDQGGNVRKGDEAEACYKLLCLGYVLGDYKEEIIDHFKNYDYDKMVMKDGKIYNSFNQVLQFYQNLNSQRINCIISAASLKMSMFKEKSESYYTGMLELNETIKLSTLSREIKSKISEFERDRGLNPYDMRGMTKIGKLTVIDERDREIERLVANSEVGMIYKISKLTTERIPVVFKSKIVLAAEKAAKEYVKENNLTGIEAKDKENEVRRTIVRESYRAVLKTIKAKEIEKYKSNPNSYKLKVKV